MVGCVWSRWRPLIAVGLGLTLVDWAAERLIAGAAPPETRAAEPAGRPQEDGLPLPSLQWNLQPGQVYLMEIVQTANTEIDVAGNKTLQPASRRAKIRWEVISADDAEIEVQLRYTEVELDLGTSAGQVVASTNPATPQIGSGKAGQLLRGMDASLKPLLDQPITLRFDRQGVVRRVVVAEPLRQHLQRDVQTRPLRHALSQEAMQELVGGFVVPLPAQPQAQWEQRRTMDLSAGVPLTHTTRYQLGPWSEGAPTVEVKFTTDLAFPEQFLLGAREPEDATASQARDPNPPGPVPPPYDFDPISRKWPRIALQDAGGTFTFDLAAGYVRQASAKSFMVTEKAYSDAKITVTISTQTEVKVRPQ
jgi:hypothetical protein